MFFKATKTICTVLGLVLMCNSVTVYAQNEQTEGVSSTEVPISIYDRPYSIDENIVDSKMLKRNTVALFGTGVGVMGLLYAMPTSFTNWEDDGQNPASKWWDNVSQALIGNGNTDWTPGPDKT